MDLVKSASGSDARNRNERKDAKIAKKVQRKCIKIFAS